MDRPSEIPHFLLLLLLLLLLFVLTFMQHIFNHAHETNHVSRVYSVQLSYSYNSRHMLGYFP